MGKWRNKANTITDKTTIIIKAIINTRISTIIPTATIIPIMLIHMTTNTVIRTNTGIAMGTIIRRDSTIRPTRRNLIVVLPWRGSAAR
jgi:hypothetical protein